MIREVEAVRARVRRCKCGCRKWRRQVLKPEGWPHVESVTTHRTWADAMAPAND